MRDHLQQCRQISLPLVNSLDRQSVMSLEGVFLPIIYGNRTYLIELCSPEARDDVSRAL